MSSLEKKDGIISGGDTQLQCHNHSSFDAGYRPLNFLLDKNIACGHR